MHCWSWREIIPQIASNENLRQNGIDASTVQYQIAALEAIVRSLQHLAGSVEQMPLFGEPQRR
jgi:hypothetical protein